MPIYADTNPRPDSTQSELLGKWLQVKSTQKGLISTIYPRPEDSEKDLLVKILQVYNS